MSELPQGWDVANLLTVATMVRGVTYTKEVVQSQSFDNSVPVIRANNIQKRGFDLSELVHVPSELVSEGQRIRAGDVVIASSSGSISVVGKAAQAPKDMYSGFGAFCTLMRPDSILNAIYFGHFFSTDHYRSTVSKLARGSNINNLKREHFASLEIPIAPAAEQTRIANQLDTLLARVQACNDRFDAIPALLKRFRQTVLDAATTGALTQDWRAELGNTAPESHESGWVKAKALHALPEGWRWAKFSEFLSGFRSGTSAVPGGDPSAYPVLRSSSVRPMEIDFEDVRYLPNMTKIRSDDLLVEGEVLFTRLSGSLEYVANCAVVRGLGDRKIYYPDRLFRAKLIRPEQGTYFELCFASPLLRMHLTVEAKSTAGHQRISMGAVTDFPIPMPPDDEQQEIINQAGVLLRFADRIEARCTAARAQAQRLSSLVLAKAFRGELVAQDPSDEPASALLARIESAKTAAAGKKESKVPVARKGRAPATINS